MSKNAKRSKAGRSSDDEAEMLAQLEMLEAMLTEAEAELDEPAPVQVKRAPHAEGLPLPAYETPRSAGMDLRAAVPQAEPITLAPGERALVPTGLHIALPEGLEAQVRPRSGLALKHGITCLNSPGTIDADYRGELKVILINLGQEPFTIARGERIAQLVVAPVIQARWVEVEALDDTSRGAGGFGSTGR